MAVLEAAEAAQRLTLVGSVEELVHLAVPDNHVQPDGHFIVGYEVPGRGFVPEAQVCRVRNGIAANYIDPALRRRDPDCMVIADGQATDKPTYRDRFSQDFEPVRAETLEWLKTQPLTAFFFESGLPGAPLNAVAICPSNAAFFALGLAMLQGIVPLDRIRDQGTEYYHGAVVYVAPPFRHTHFAGKQIVVHNRRFETADLHELFSYNLYPGPSAKKGVYGMLLTLGERAEIPWTTAHCSTVQVVTPYENRVTIMHEGASGGGKSEMLEHMHREADGRLRLGINTVTKDARHVTLPRGCELAPVTDDMALCHPELQAQHAPTRGGRPGRAPSAKLSLIDAERAWFVRVNHINRYDIDPASEPAQRVQRGGGRWRLDHADRAGRARWALRAAPAARGGAGGPEPGSSGLGRARTAGAGVKARSRTMLPSVTLSRVAAGRAQRAPRERHRERAAGVTGGRGGPLPGRRRRTTPRCRGRGCRP